MVLRRAWQLTIFLEIMFGINIMAVINDVHRRFGGGSGEGYLHQSVRLNEEALAGK
jgi:hypothetical protein